MLSKYLWGGGEGRGGERDGGEKEGAKDGGQKAIIPPEDSLMGRVDVTAKVRVRAGVEVVLRLARRATAGRRKSLEAMVSGLCRDCLGGFRRTVLWWWYILENQLMDCSFLP